MWQTIALLCVAGALGTLARYGLDGFIQKFSAGFPFGTLGVNALGCLLFGLVWTLAEERMVISGQTRFILLTGFMGAFTTFSTFTFETAQMLRDTEWALGLINVFLQLGAGLVCLFLGMLLGRQF